MKIFFTMACREEDRSCERKSVCGAKGREEKRREGKWKEEHHNNTFNKTTVVFNICFATIIFCLIEKASIQQEEDEYKYVDIFVYGCRMFDMQIQHQIQNYEYMKRNNNEMEWNGMKREEIEQAEKHNNDTTMLL